VKRGDASSWGDEVVRALCTRIPGQWQSVSGHNVTVPCEICASKFCPCLCSLSEDKKQGRTRHLQAPRIVQVSEARVNRGGRPGGLCHGHLNSLLTGSSAMGVDRMRLLVMGEKTMTSFTSGQGTSDDVLARIASLSAQLSLTEGFVGHVDKGVVERFIVDQGLSAKAAKAMRFASEAIQHIILTETEGKPSRLQCPRKGTVLERWQDRYLIETDGVQPWHQVLDLSAGQVYLLGTMVHRETMVIGASPTASSQRSPQPQVVEEVQFEYEDENEAIGDMTFMEYGGEHFFVEAVRPEGKAARAGVSPGQQLTRMWRCEARLRGAGARTLSSSMRFRAGNIYKPVEPLEFLPRFLRSNPEISAQDATWQSKNRDMEEKAGWPCRLSLNALPHGWRIVGQVHQDGEEEHFTYDHLRGLIEAEQGATLIFERPAWEVVSSRSHIVRHENRWERQLDGKQTRERDVLLLEEWGLRSKLTPAQLGWTFRQLMSVIAKEQEEFESARMSQESIIIELARKCVEIAIEVEAKTASPQKLQETQQELGSLMPAVPIYFLTELLAMCRRAFADGDDAGTAARGRSSSSTLVTCREKTLSEFSAMLHGIDSPGEPSSPKWWGPGPPRSRTNRLTSSIKSLPGVNRTITNKIVEARTGTAGGVIAGGQGQQAASRSAPAGATATATSLGRTVRLQEKKLRRQQDEEDMVTSPMVDWVGRARKGDLEAQAVLAEIYNQVNSYLDQVYKGHVPANQRWWRGQRSQVSEGEENHGRQAFVEGLWACLAAGGHHVDGSGGCGV